MKESALCQVIEEYLSDDLAGIANCPPIAVGDFRTGAVGGADSEVLTYYGSTTENGTYELINDSLNSALSTTKGASVLNQIPAIVLQSTKFLKIVCASGQHTFKVILKS